MTKTFATIIIGFLLPFAYVGDATAGDSCVRASERKSVRAGTHMDKVHRKFGTKGVKVSRFVFTPSGEQRMIFVERRYRKCNGKTFIARYNRVPGQEFGFIRTYRR